MGERRTPRWSQPSAGRREDGTPRGTEGVRRPAQVHSPTCSPTERSRRSAHRARLLGGIPARRLHPSGEEVGLAAQGLHPAPPPALTRGTHRRRLVGCWSRYDVRRHRGWGAPWLLEPHAAPRELRLAAPVREQAILAEALEAGGQEMKQEAPEECNGLKGHEPLPVAMGRVFPPQGHPPLLQGQQAPIRDRHTMRITREILQHRPRGPPTGGLA